MSSGATQYRCYLYDEFGDSLGAWGSNPYNAYRYTGQEYDGKPAFAYNLRAREYYPKLGRFMQNDPIGDKGGSLNWYVYVANNPINATDPTGRIVYRCVDGVHVYVRVAGQKYYGAWGFYPVGAPLSGIYSGLTNTWMPGYVKAYETGGTCYAETFNDCQDEAVYNAIHRLAYSGRLYHLAFYNCRDWADEVLSVIK